MPEMLMGFSRLKVCGVMAQIVVLGSGTLSTAPVFGAPVLQAMHTLTNALPPFEFRIFTTWIDCDLPYIQVHSVVDRI
jgi:hypothetical protein